MRSNTCELILCLLTHFLDLPLHILLHANLLWPVPSSIVLQQRKFTSDFKRTTTTLTRQLPWYASDYNCDPALMFLNLSTATFTCLPFSWQSEGPVQCHHSTRVPCSRTCRRYCSLHSRSTFKLQLYIPCKCQTPFSSPPNVISDHQRTWNPEAHAAISE